MRNLFDQYSQAENRLTHALMCCLAEDKVLLADFVRDFVKVDTPPGKLRVTTQKFPAEIAEPSEEEAERRGIPDAWIFDGEWALVIESKVASHPNEDQLLRHRNIALRQGFQDPLVVLLTTIKPAFDPKNVCVRYWSQLYSWALDRKSSSPWAARLCKYMEILEGKLVQANYLVEGTLTTFSGIQFNEDNPYTYSEARRLLKLMMAELKARPALRKLGMDPNGQGRKAITGTNARSVWDFIPFASTKGGMFTHHPHLTLAIEERSVIVQITLPNALAKAYRNALSEGGYEQFRKVVHQFVKSGATLFSKGESARPFVAALQRHYKSQRDTSPTRDAYLHFDARTAVQSARGRVKVQDQWLRAAFEAYTAPRSNIQLAMGVEFFYMDDSAIIKPSAIDVVEKAWLSCRPLIHALGTGHETTP